MTGFHIRQELPGICVVCTASLTANHAVLALQVRNQFFELVIAQAADEGIELREPTEGVTQQGGVESCCHRVIKVQQRVPGDGPRLRSCRRR
jgi:hypothetical protein